MPETVTALTVGEALVDAAARLSAAGIEDADVDARRLVADATGGVRADPRAVLDAAARARLEHTVVTRAERVPLQLVLGTWTFRHLELTCCPGVFIPRPETEVVAGLAITWVQSHRAGASGTKCRSERTRSCQTHPGRGGGLVVEVGTGTGAIGLSVAVEVAGVRVVAGDADRDAVALARHNTERLRRGEAGVVGPAPGSTVEVVTSDLLDGIDDVLRGRVDVLVANPPYLPAGDVDGLAPEVADHDPHGALAGGPDGHEIVDALLALAPAWLVPGGTVIVEIDERRGADARRAATAAGLVDVHVEPDLTGADRAVVAHRPQDR